jgi:hypothetical protein
MKPGYEASVSGDGDRGQEPHLADVANQGVDFAERTHSFADLDRVHSDALTMVCLRGVRLRLHCGAALLMVEVAMQRIRAH